LLKISKQFSNFSLPNDVPEDTLAVIFSFLPLADQCRAQRVCHLFKRILFKDPFALRCLEKLFENIIDLPKSDQESYQQSFSHLLETIKSKKTIFNILKANKNFSLAAQKIKDRDLLEIADILTDPNEWSKIKKEKNTFEKAALVRGKVQVKPANFFSYQKHKLSHIVEELHQCFPNLTFLFLGKNNISSMRPLSSFSSLHVLSLTNNQICTIPPDLCKSLAELEWIDLSNNFIKKIPKEIQFLKRLREFLLNHNQICELPENEILQLKDLKNLELYENPIKKPPESLMSLQQKEILKLGKPERPSLLLEIFLEIISPDFKQLFPKK
jgi:Leucine-rich repeat (LRR) protein